MNSQLIVNRIMLGILVVVLTVIMNIWLKPDRPQQTQIYTQKKIVNVEKKKVETQSFLSNNQKAALFLAFPLGGMLWIASYTLIKNRKKITKMTKIEREPKVIFN